MTTEAAPQAQSPSPSTPTTPPQESKAYSLKELGVFLPGVTDTPNPLNGEVESPAVEAESAEVETEEAEAPEAEATEATEEPLKDYQTVTISFGDEILDIPLDTKVPTKVAGEMLEPTLEELRRDYSARTNWGKKYQELGEMKKQITLDKTKAEKALSTFFAVSKENPVLAMSMGLEASGMAPKDAIAHTINSLATQVLQIAKLDGPGKEAYLDKLLHQRERQKFDVERSNFEELRTETEVRGAFSKVASSRGLDFDEFTATAEEFIQAAQANNWKLAESDLTPDGFAKKVLQFHDSSVIYSNAKSVGAKFGASESDVLEVAKEIDINTTKSEIEEIFKILTSSDNNPKPKAVLKTKPSRSPRKEEAARDKPEEDDEISRLVSDLLRTPLAR